MPADPKLSFRYGVGHPVKQRKQLSVEKHAIKIGAQGFPDSEY